MNTSITDGTLYQFLRGELDAQQVDRLKQELDRDADLRERFDSLKWIHELSETSESIAWTTPSSWNKIDSATTETPVVTLKPKASRYSTWRIAASFAVLIASAWAIWTVTERGSSYDHNYTAQQSHDKYELPDGTVVWLDEGAEIRYTSSGRHAALDGTAYFDVMRDENAPFTLELESGSIEVLGTEFNVRQTSELVRVAVTEGKVRFSSDTDARVLAVGQMAELNKKNNLLGEQLAASKRDLLWHNQVWSYDQAQLSQVLSEINEVFHSDIRLANEDLALCTFSTASTKASLSEWLEILTRIYNFNVERTPSGYLLQGGNCSE